MIPERVPSGAGGGDGSSARSMISASRGSAGQKAIETCWYPRSSAIRQLALLVGPQISIARYQARIWRRPCAMSGSPTASRCCWTGKCLLTPAVFAYSMLYPYTDNFLDDPGISPDRKRSLNKNLAHWLAGRDVASLDPHQKQVRRLVGMIEAQFDRRQFPSVFSSLQAIHAGQEGSLIQHDPDAHLTESDLIAISIRKGGASVLADGYLVCGCLDIPEEDFCMGYGAFLQFSGRSPGCEERSKGGPSDPFHPGSQDWWPSR